MDSLLRENQVNARLINNALVNFRKLGKAKQTPAVIRSRISLLKEYWAKFQDVHIRIEMAATDGERKANSYFSNDGFGQTEEAFLTALDTMTSTLPVEGEQPTLACNESSHASNHESNLSVRLPRIELTKFSGDYIEWENFKDLFQALVASNDSLSEVQKLHYLKTSLTGEAQLLLNNISTAAANYEVAWGMLSDRYSNERALINAHLQRLFDSNQIGFNVLANLKTLRDNCRSALSALRNLGRPVDSWDDVLVFHFIQKLDRESRREWECRLGDAEGYPTLSDWDSFINVRIRTLESLASSRVQPERVGKNKQIQNRNVKVHLNAFDSCIVCGANYALYRCDMFRSKSVEQRLSLVRDLRRCFNCLQGGHFPKECPSSRCCSKCKGRHHTLLHSDRQTAQTRAVASNSKSAVTVNSTPSDEPSTSTNSARTSSQQNYHAISSQNINTHFGSTAGDQNKVMLATAWVKISTPVGRIAKIRALIDPGSEATFISEAVAKSLRAPRQHVQVTASGIGAGSTAKVQSAANLILEPCHGRGPAFMIQALVLPRLTFYRNSPVSCTERWIHLQGLEWADTLQENASIDLIIGADYYSAVLKQGLQKGAIDAPVAQNTIFGWVLIGSTQVSNTHATKLHVHYANIDSELNNLLKGFWEVEGPPPSSVPFLSEEDQKCEDHFRVTHSRTKDGKYVVRLPFKNESSLDIGLSKDIAVRSFLHAEKRLAKDPEQAATYNAFLDEYLRLGHMCEAPMEGLSSTQNVFLTHHPVIRKDSSTTRLRVVFNASKKTSNGSTLNDHLLVGPKLQADITAIILRWRTHRFVYAADIEKMFRQIWIDPRDTRYQMIVWRPNPDDDVRSCSLLTVTYGTACAPFLANRVIKQLALDEGTNFPLSVPILNEQIYVDDALFGADDRVSALQLRQQVTAHLKLGGFHLRKWTSNCPQLLAEIPYEDHERASSHSFQETEELKMLGLLWLPNTDEFRFRFKISAEPTDILTKRTILSAIARIFDPLGWIAPVVITAKIYMQKLWVTKLNWDDQLPNDLHNQWLEYSADLAELQNVAIPRWIGLGSRAISYELHGFADASQSAFAAVVYLRVVTIKKEIRTHLLLAKTKVAPLKPLTVPRLELSAAVIMTRLIEHVLITLKLQSCPVYCWTDSAVALAWIHKHPSQLQTFTAHRVAEIQSRVSNASWRHVPTDLNPADCASRGLTATGLLQHPLWWHGPPWLLKPSKEWPNATPSVPKEAEFEMKRQVRGLHVQKQTEWDLPIRTSSWQKLLRITSYVFRFTKHARSKKSEFRDLVITTSEITAARKFWITYAQNHHFQKEIRALKRNDVLPKGSPLLRLNPFIDEDDTVRVGGRLRNSQLSQRFPIILPAHRIAELIITDCHYNTLHGGTQLTLSVLRQVFWIIGARRLVKNLVYHCIACVRARANTAKQLMGDLPAARVTPSRPFTHSGLDYAGPFLARAYSGRGHKTQKIYIVLFVCLSTRAIHLETVLDYTTAAFLAALDRFVSRRGLPTDLYSDNGTNFKGANKELMRAFRQVSSDPEVRARFAADQITWHLIPPTAPHFGGIWEAGVKCVKTNLKHMLLHHSPTIAEFSTLLCKVEACLNSRPLAPLTDDPESWEVLTPGHFLIGTALKTVPVPSALEVNVNRLSRWQLVQQLTERFWRAWAKDYLQSLQTRTKWHKRMPNLQVGDLVLLQSATLPPAKWELGRIDECHPGKDGLIRVVTVRTKNSRYVRPITRLCKLPISS